MKKVLVNLYKWLIQTVIFSLLPLIFYITIHWMFQIDEDPVRKYINELCTFTLVISSSVTIELSKEKYQYLQVREIIFPAFLSLQVIFFIIYGAILVCFELEIALQPDIMNNIFLFVKLISAIHFIIAFLLQIIGGLSDV